MEITLKIKIKVDDNDTSKCGNCDFLDGLYDECKLFNKELDGTNRS